MPGCSLLDFNLYVVIYDRKEEKMLPVTFSPPLCLPILNLNVSVVNSPISSISGSNLYCTSRTFFASAKALLEPSTEQNPEYHLF